LRRERRTLENKESALQSTLTDLARVEATLAQRETDLQAVQEALTALEADARREGDNHTSAKFSLQLELDRLIRDNERLEDDLKRSRRERDDHDDGRRDRDTQLDRLHAENRDLAAQLAAQTQARLNMSEKLDGVQSSLSTAETERNSLREKLKTLEGRLSKEQRELRNADQMHRDQLTERNTLLLTIYQYMDRILGPDKAVCDLYFGNVPT
jgi:chromosome segregation ATPase